MNEKYGGVLFAIDEDIDDAPVAGSDGMKTYRTWDVTIVDYPDSLPNTAIYGINSGFILNELTQRSPIFTGVYCVQCSFGSINVGFNWTTTNSFSSINGYVNGEAKPFGVNYAGQIVGHYYPYQGVAGPEQGFFMSTLTGPAAPLNAPGAVRTLPSGINDASQIAGSWSDGTTQHGFTYDNGTWTTFDHSGTKATWVVSINGIGQMAGWYYNSQGTATTGFIYSKVDGWINVSCPGQPSTALTGINNNGQAVGFCGPTSFIYDISHATISPISALPPYSQPFGVSDSNVPAGNCFCIMGSLVDGFYATPNP